MAAFGELSPVLQALVATLGTWLLTAAGASLVLFARRVPRRYLDASMGFAAGVMIFVVAEELIPESQSEGNVHQATAGVILGFAVMMTLAVALG
ncbi:MAG TPA: zinc transporter [Methylomirabilota bacterium]|nr:zinc transporter [Methylomirabilota bacterium]